MTLPMLEASSPCASRDAVLATPELLEAILVFVSMNRLLVSVQRVCKHWKDLIDRSPQLQKHLYFWPEREASRNEGEDGQAPTMTDHPSPNPLLREVFQELLPGHQKVSHRYGHRTFTNMWGTVAESSEARKKKRDALKRAGASWRRMLVAQPPPQELVLAASGRYMNRAKRILEKIFRFSRGPVQMGFLYDLLCHGVIHDYFDAGWVEVAWAADELRAFEQSIPPSDKHNVVVMGFYTNLQYRSPEDTSQERRGFVSRGKKHERTYLCEEYDADAIERQIVEAPEQLSA